MHHTAFRLGRGSGCLIPETSPYRPTLSAGVLPAPTTKSLKGLFQERLLTAEQPKCPFNLSKAAKDLLDGVADPVQGFQQFMSKSTWDYARLRAELKSRYKAGTATGLRTAEMASGIRGWYQWAVIPIPLPGPSSEGGIRPGNEATRFLVSLHIEYQGKYWPMVDASIYEVGEKPDPRKLSWYAEHLASRGYDPSEIAYKCALRQASEPYSSFCKAMWGLVTANDAEKGYLLWELPPAGEELSLAGAIEHLKDLHEYGRSCFVQVDPRFPVHGGRWVQRNRKFHGRQIPARAIMIRQLARRDEERFVQVNGKSLQHYSVAMGNEARRPTHWAVLEWPMGQSAPSACFLMPQVGGKDTKKQRLNGIETSMRAFSQVRSTIEYLNNSLGLRDYRGKSEEGWHRHLTCVMLSHSFLIEQNLAPLLT